MLSILLLLLFTQTVSSIKICHGVTPPCKTNWRQYQGGPNGLYVDVDISHCGFDSTPTVTCSMGGNSGLWTALGGSYPYHTAPRTFRVYVHQPDVTLTAAYVNEKCWYINYIAMQDDD